MKNTFKIPLIVLSALMLLASSCSEKENGNEDPVDSKGIAMEAISLSTKGGAAGDITRALDNYSVLTANDPTYPFDSKQGWDLDVKIYKGANPYTYGEGTFIWNSGQSLWMSKTTSDEIYFPNYTKQRVTLQLYPDTWNGEIAIDQSTADKLLAQDIMVEETDPMVVNPAHKPGMKVRHGHSMFDIILKYLTIDNLVGGRVIVDGKEYTPYRVPNVNQLEYLLIVPVGVEDPVIEIETSDGASYRQTVYTNKTKINTCYCFTLEGVELVLAANMVADWVTGEAQSGDYTSVTSYPTFRGPADVSCVLYFDNGLSQTLTFNSRGETTVRPSGRNVTRIVCDELGIDTTLSTPIILGTMIVNLNPYLTI